MGCSLAYGILLKSRGVIKSPQADRKCSATHKTQSFSPPPSFRNLAQGSKKY